MYETCTNPLLLYSFIQSTLWFFSIPFNQHDCDGHGAPYIHFICSNSTHKIEIEQHSAYIKVSTGLLGAFGTLNCFGYFFSSFLFLLEGTKSLYIFSGWLFFFYFLYLNINMFIGTKPVCTESNVSQSNKMKHKTWISTQHWKIWIKMLLHSMKMNLTYIRSVLWAINTLKAIDQMDPMAVVK